MTAGFLMVAGAYITPASATGSGSDNESFYQTPRETPTRTPTATPNVFATQLHEALVTQSALTNRSSRLEAAVTQQASIMQTMTEANREIRIQMKQSETEINLLKYGIVIAALVGTGYIIRRFYSRSSHGGGHH